MPKLKERIRVRLKNLFTDVHSARLEPGKIVFLDPFIDQALSSILAEVKADPDSLCSQGHFLNRNGNGEYVCFECRRAKNKKNYKNHKEGKMTQDRVELRGALARGYCTKRNGHKVLDADLIEDMAREVEKLSEEENLRAIREAIRKFKPLKPQPKPEPPPELPKRIFLSHPDCKDLGEKYNKLRRCVQWLMDRA